MVHFKYKSCVELYVDSRSHEITYKNLVQDFVLKYTTNIELPKNVSRIDYSTLDLRLNQLAISGHLLDEVGKSFVWLYNLDRQTEQTQDAFAVKQDGRLALSVYSKVTCGSLIFLKKSEANAKLLWVTGLYQVTCAISFRKPPMPLARGDKISKRRVPTYSAQG